MQFRELCYPAWGFGLLARRRVPLCNVKQNLKELNSLTELSGDLFFILTNFDCDLTFFLSLKLSLLQYLYL